jgi:hypothetical protein
MLSSMLQTVFILAPIVILASAAEAQQTPPSATTTAATGPSTRRWQRTPPKTYFVDPAGNDAANGSEAAPFATIQKAADVVNPGDTVRIRGGVYGPVLMSRSGNYFGRTITFQAEPGQEVVIDGAGLERPVRAVIDTNSCDYIRLMGLTVRNAPLCGIGAYGSWRISIESCRTENTAHSGIIIDKSGFVEVVGCEITGACNDSAPMRGGEESLSVKRSQNVLVIYNHIHHTGHEGVDIKEGSKHVRVLNNEVDHVQRQGLYADSWDVATTDVRFENNSVHDCMFGVVAGAETGGLLSDVWFVNNLIYNNKGPGMIVQDWGGRGAQHPVKDVYFINNTVVNNGNGGRNGEWGGGMYLENAVAENVVVRNNILAGNPQGAFVVQGGKMPASAVIDHNLVFGPAGASMGEKTIVADPLFVAPDEGDFGLSAGSPALGAGTSELAPTTAIDGTPRPAGQPVDIGAYAGGR